MRSPQNTAEETRGCVSFEFSIRCADAAFRTHRSPDLRKLGRNPLLRLCLAALAIDCDLHVGGDLTMQLHRNVKLAKALERIVEMDLATIDVKAFAFEGRSDVGRGHRSEQ